MDPAFMFGHLDPANHFAMEGLIMAFAAELTCEGKPLLKLLLMDVMGGEITKVDKPHQKISAGFIISSKFK